MRSMVRWALPLTRSASAVRPRRASAGDGSRTPPQIRRALRGQVAHDPRRLAHAASGVVKEADDAAAQREPAVAQRDRIKRQVPGLAGADPGPKVAAEQDRARRARTATRRLENLAHGCT